MTNMQRILINGVEYVYVYVRACDIFLNHYFAEG